MPKKFKGENSKAVQAKAVKAARAADEKAKKEKEIEDAYWKDDDKHVAKKQQRKEDREKKREDQLEKQREREKLYEEEMKSIKPGKPAAVTATKVTRHQIETHKQQNAAAAKEQAPKKMRNVTVLEDTELEENVNRAIPVEGEARSVEDAIGVLSLKEKDLERHPEKRVKAAYTAFEEENLPILKAENPNMRLSQLKQILKKDWMKSPENPLNQRTMAYNAKKSS